jgi:CSLREA domain-containing protein
MAIAIQVRHSAAMLAALLPFAATPARGADIHVADFDDATADPTTCTLRQAVRSANENTVIGSCEAGQSTLTDRILVPAGTHVVNLTAGSDEDSALTGDLDLLQNVEILGVSTAMSVVDGTGGTEIDRLFDVHAGVTVLMQQLTLRGGNATDTTGRGGVIRLDATSDLTLDQLDLSLGQAKTGGGVYSSGKLTLRDCRIAGNQTVVEGAVGNHGGGIAHDATGGTIMILDSEISGNTADEAGGGLWVAGGPLTIRRSKVSANTAGTTGGGLFVSSSNYLVTHSEFAENRANAGGGIYLMDMTGEVQRCAILFNQALATGGGVHDAMGGFVRFSTISGNSAPLGGGAYTDSAMTLFDADTIADNLGGGGVHNATGAFFEITILANNIGGNCSGTPPNFGAFNMEDIDTCGFVPVVIGPNFPNTDPKLGPLVENHGPTRSMVPMISSPAIDAVSSEIRTNCQNMLDQRSHPRGRPRTQNGMGQDVFLCDIGAVEWDEPFYVDSTADGVDANVNDDMCRTATNTCTLRAAIQQANALPGTSVIALRPGLHVLSLAGSDENAGATGDLDIDPPLEIYGAGADQTIVSGADLDRIFDVGAPPHVDSGIDATLIRNLTITGGNSGSENGGAILLRGFPPVPPDMVEPPNPLELRNVRVFDNEGGRGSAISSSTGTFFGTGDRPLRLIGSSVEQNSGGMALFLHEAYIERSALVDNDNTAGSNGGAAEFLRVELVNSTVSGNDAGASGAFFASRAAVESSTIAENTAGSQPGGVFVLERSGFRNSIVARNRVGGTSFNCSSNSAAISSGGHNITDTGVGDCELSAGTDLNAMDPLLDVLNDNGGLGRTHLPLAGSPAIDSGSPLTCPVVDQRAFPRPVNGDGNPSVVCDRGAVEIPEPGFAAGLAASCALLALLARRRR